MRDYDPTTGRYLQADPLGLVDGASVYGYARQSPSRWTDPRGEDAGALVGGVIGGIIDGGAVVGGIAGAGVGGVLGILLIPSELGDGTVQPGAVLAEGAVAEDEECNSRDCEKARPYQLERAGIGNAHKFKTGWGAVPNSRFDICASKDGSIVIRAQGECGRSGPTTATYERWK